MIGTIVIIVLLLLVIPVGIIMSTLPAAGLLSTMLNNEVDERHKDSELLEISRSEY